MVGGTLLATLIDGVWAQKDARAWGRLFVIGRGWPRVDTLGGRYAMSLHVGGRYQASFGGVDVAQAVLAEQCFLQGATNQTRSERAVSASTYMTPSRRYFTTLARAM